jgi:hypothetical protein
MSTSFGRGYLPPVLKRALQPSANRPSLFYEHVRSSSAIERFHQFNENRPPDAQYFLNDDDREVAQAFGLQSSSTNVSISGQSTDKADRTQSLSVRTERCQQIAAYPPKANDRVAFKSSNEVDLLDRLQDDFDSQPDFHCHSFGLGGRGRPLSAQLVVPSLKIFR